MSYSNIVRKCSVCQCCGACDYEHELENNCVSGDYNPVLAALMLKQDGDNKPITNIISKVFGVKTS